MYLRYPRNLILALVISFPLPGIAAEDADAAATTATGSPLDEKDQAGDKARAADNQRQDGSSAKGRHGAGVGTGYQGYRGLGDNDAPDHRQYGSPPRGTAAAPNSTEAQAKDGSVIRANGTALLLASSRGSLADVQALLQQGIDPNTQARDRNGRTPLILATIAGHVDVVKALIKIGATVNDRDSSGLAALNWAALRNQQQIAELLLKNAADVNTQDNDHVSPLLYAVGRKNDDMIALLVKNGADLEAESRESKMTPLLLAAEQGDIESAKLLLNFGANVNGTNEDNYSPLMAASEEGDVAFVELLLARGADKNVIDSKRMTALMLAKKNANQKVIQLLESSNTGSK